MGQNGVKMGSKWVKTAHRAPRNCTKKSQNALKMAKKKFKKFKKLKMIQKMGLNGGRGRRGGSGGRMGVGVGWVRRGGSDPTHVQ